MKFSNIQHVFFDLDHTLWDFDKNSGLAFKAIFQKHRIEVELEQFLEQYSPINAQYWKLFRENRVSQQKLRHGRLQETFQALQIVLTDLQIEQLALDYIDHLPLHNFLLDGAMEMLEYLQRKKYDLHIITNGFREVQYKKMRSSGIFDYFQTITTSEDAGVKKPNPQIFRYALEKAGALPENSLMIGDNFEADILGATSSGMDAILYNYYQKEFSPDCRQVLKMKELVNYL